MLIYTIERGLFLLSHCTNFNYLKSYLMASLDYSVEQYFNLCNRKFWAHSLIEVIAFFKMSVCLSIFSVHFASIDMT